MIQMITPEIAICLAENGYVVQWRRPAAKPSGAHTHDIVTRVCLDSTMLIAAITQGQEDIK